VNPHEAVARWPDQAQHRVASQAARPETVAIILAGVSGSGSAWLVLLVLRGLRK
jgi:hypothetical protein